LKHGRYQWERRSERINWALFDAVDPTQMAQQGDLNSVLFFADKLTCANISEAEAKEFGTRSALNAFMVLQLACDYYQSRNDVDAALEYTERVKEFNRQILFAKDELEKARERVDELTALVARQKQQEQKLHAMLKKSLARCKKLRNKAMSSPTEELTETGAVPPPKARKTKAVIDDLSDGEVGAIIADEDLSDGQVFESGSDTWNGEKNHSSSGSDGAVDDDDY
jgi:hypothetical protein